MSTLGLNAAQTGRGMGAALVASALGAGRAIQGMRNLGSAAYHSKPGQAAANKVSDTFSKAANKLGVSGARVPQNGMLSAKQVMDFAKNPNSINKNDLGKVNGRCIRPSSTFMERMSKHICHSSHAFSEIVRPERKARRKITITSLCFSGTRAFPIWQKSSCALSAAAMPTEKRR